MDAVTETEPFSFVVPEEHDRTRADKAVHAFKNDLSRSQIQKLFAKGLVWREDDALSKSDKVRAGDILCFSIPPVEKLDLTPREIPLDVIYEDSDMLAVNKPCGMVVHPGAGTGGDTLVHALLHHCKGKLSGIGGVERPGIVHRLDKETTGVIVVAKSDKAFLGISSQFAERKTQKTYYAIVSGSPDKDSGTIKEPIGRHSVHRQKMTVRSDGRYAHSDWEVVERFANASLLRVTIHTGRTHQIRVHMAFIGHPLLGDETYGWKPKGGINPGRVCLHAAELVLEQPLTRERLILKAALPEDLQSLVEQLRQHG
ncbi:MAG: RluA family pseudouridine synthase [Opitutales bacterium]|nr:RluA family pseudouridine synthase [Opitutales bacterium]